MSEPEWSLAGEPRADAWGARWDLPIRMAAGTLFLAIAAGRALWLTEQDWLSIWAAETLIYVLIVVGYVRRVPAFEHARGFAELVLPLLAAPFPLLLLATKLDPIVEPGVGLATILAGDAISLWSYAALGGSFAITVEARPLRASGPYRWVRHPIYLGQLVATAGVVLLRFSWPNVGLWVAFAILQVARARLEERKMLRATPGYEDYRRRTRAFLPWIV